MKNKKGIILMIIGATMIVSSLLLLIYNTIEDENAGKISQEILDKMVNVIEAQEENEIDLMPIVEIDGYEYMGYISISKIDIELPVMYEWDYSRLKKAPCRQKGTISTDDLVIAGHAYAKHFNKIRKLDIGDEIIITNMNGQKFRYEVMMCELLNSDQSDEMLNSNWDLTLYTCNYDSSKRITVRANQVEW